MNLFKKIGVAIVGMAMAVGVGVALGTKPEAKMAEAAIEPYATCDFTAQTASSSSYTVSDDGFDYGSFKVSGGANNNGGWAYMKFGAKKAKAADETKVTDNWVKSGQLNEKITKVGIQILASTVGSEGSVTWGLGVYSDSEFSTSVDTVSLTGLKHKTAGTYYLTPTSGDYWSSGNYYKVNLHVENTTTTNGMLWVEKIIFYYDAPNPVTSLELSGTGISNNALSIGSSDEDAHSVSVTINSDATDKQINIAHKSGTNGLFTLGGLTSGHITCNASGVGSFTLTGTGGTSGSETFSVTSNSTPAQTVDLVVTALDDSATYYDITTISHYSLSGVTHIVSGEDASLILVADTKYNLPGTITVINTDTEEEISDSLYAYDDNDGSLLIVDVAANLTVTFDANPASIVSIAVTGQKTKLYLGDSFTFGGTVIGTYDDVASTTEELNTGYTVDSSAFDGNVVGKYTIIVSYTGCDNVEYDVDVVDTATSVTITEIDSLTGNTGSYSYYNGDHTIDDTIIVSSDVMMGTGDNAGKIQIKKTSGCLYNKSTSPLAHGIKMIKLTGTNAENFTVKFSATIAGSEAEITSKEISTDVYCVTIGGSSYYMPNGNDSYRYFYLSNSASGAAYLTEVKILTLETAAEEFAKVYLAAYTCNGNGTSSPSLNDGYTYELLGDLYGALATDVKAILTNVADNHTASYGADKVKEFGERYYWIVYNHGAGYDLMGRVSAGAITPKSAANFGQLATFSQEYSVTTVIIIVSIVGIVAIGGYFYIRRRKENN